MTNRQLQLAIVRPGVWLALRRFRLLANAYCRAVSPIIIWLEASQR